MSSSSSPPFNYGTPCAACKFLRRRCLPDCIFAPHFPAEKPQKFEFVHRIYGASNISRLLTELSFDQRDQAVNSLVYEAEARLKDPVYGCVGFVSILQQNLKQLQNELSVAKAELSTYLGSGSGTQPPNVPIPLPQLPSIKQLLVQLPPLTVRGQTRQSSSTQQRSDHPCGDPAGYVTSYGFSPNDQIQPQPAEGQMTNNVGFRQRQLQPQLFGSQQPPTAEQQQPATARLHDTAETKSPPAQSSLDENAI